MLDGTDERLLHDLCAGSATTNRRVRFHLRRGTNEEEDRDDRSRAVILRGYASDDARPR